MNQGKKKIILLATLVLPALAYLFLRMFGENEFALPVYYENGVLHTLDNPPDKRDAEIAFAYRGEGPEPGWETYCSFDSVVHTVDNAEFKTLDGYTFNTAELNSNFLVALLPMEDEEEVTRFTMSELMRIRNDYTLEQLQIVLVFANQNLENFDFPVTSQLAGWHGVLGTPEQVVDWANCQLVIPHALARRLKPEEPHTYLLTLVDEQNRVRGYYDGRKQKETDRLDTELGVLLQEE